MTAGSRHVLSALVRIAICVFAVYWLARATEWDQFKQAILAADWGPVVLSFAVFGPTPVVLALRLKWLLAVHGVSLSVWQAVKVTFAGNFIIGTTPLGTHGGDAMKAYYIARDTPYKHEAVTTVFVDRVIGVISLVGLAGVVCLANWRDPAFSKWGQIIGLTVLVLLVGGAVYFSGRLRRLLRIDRFLLYLPLGSHIHRIDQAALEFRNRPGRVAGGLVLTVVLQVIAIISHFLIGWGLNMVGEDPWGALPVYLAFVPICFLAGALPIGAMELTYVELFARSAGLGTPETATFLSLLSRLIQLLWAMPGVLVVLKAGRPQPITDSEPADAAVASEGRPH
ncbi:MAG TPA: lysylphosphatidylglycerol synthase transmembrane domain-containing protein [Phycisphaerae bacterium]|nr:lysylphosphatidylglycerol synthase transmembrane domain-containing protein [Phycisphaerae bacterium]